MVIITKTAITNFCRSHADATEALNNWYDITQMAAHLIKTQ